MKPDQLSNERLFHFKFTTTTPRPPFFIFLQQTHSNIFQSEITSTICHFVGCDGFRYVQTGCNLSTTSLGGWWKQLCQNSMTMKPRGVEVEAFRMYLYNRNVARVFYPKRLDLQTLYLTYGLGRLENAWVVKNHCILICLACFKQKQHFFVHVALALINVHIGYVWVYL